MSAAAWAALAGAVIAETAGTISLRYSSSGSRWWLVPTVIGYVVALSMLSLTLALGTPLGVAYGIWVAAGVAIVALASRFLFKEPLTPTIVAGVALIMLGVLLIELGTPAITTQ